jgi:hypothetical protein
MSQPARGNFSNKTRERKEDRLKDDYEVRTDLSLKLEEERKKENETMASRSIKY